MKLDKKKSALKNNTDYIDILAENTKNYKGKFSKIICSAPEIYSLLHGLLSDTEYLSNDDRKSICAAVAYFILPLDAYSEEIVGPKGYIDDLFLSIFVFRKLMEKFEFEFLLNYWGGEIEELEYILSDKTYGEMGDFLGQKIPRIFDYVGFT
jgi:uncharacterized membrane protein YkvA (DUF1232 family)